MVKKSGGQSPFDVICKAVKCQLSQLSVTFVLLGYSDMTNPVSYAGVGILICPLFRLVSNLFER